MQIDPEVIELEDLAAAANIKMSAVLARAGVATTTHWRWVNEGADPKAKTLRKVRAALDEMRAAS